MLLSDARTRVAAYIDDDGSRWTNAEIDQKLKTALETTCQLYAAKGGSRLDEILTVATASDGYCDLTAYKPLQLQAVQLNAGGIFTPLAQLTNSDFVQHISSAVSLKIRLVRTPTFPSDPTANIVYGPNISFESMDELICIKAARMLLVKDRELDQSLEMQYRELLSDMLSAENTIQIYDFPTGIHHEYRHPYAFYYVPYGIYVGYKRI